MFGRGRKGGSSGPSSAATGPDLEALAAVLPARAGWEGFVGRVVLCCGDLAAPEGSTTLAAGCAAASAVDKTRLWERLAPAGRRARQGFEARVRLGLFFAGGLKYLLPRLCAARVSVNGVAWEPFYRSLPDFLDDHGGEPEITWRESPPHAGRVLTLAAFFLRRKEVVEELTPVVAQEVFDYLRPDGQRGLFGTMLGDAGQGVDRAEPVDIAGVFLEALAQAVAHKEVRVNTRVKGHVFVTPAVWFLTTPVGLDCVTELLRKRSRGRRHDLTRHAVFEALRSGSCLAGVEAGGAGKAARVHEVDSGDWEAPLELKGLPVLSGKLPGRPTAPLFDGTVTLKRENVDGNRTD